MTGMDDGFRARIRGGDPVAFALLYDECVRPVYNHAFRLTGDWNAAEEVVAVTFLEAWRLRSRVEPIGGSLRPWLLGIATNVVIALCVWAGLDYAATAEALGIPVGTVRSRLARARRKLAGDAGPLRGNQQRPIGQEEGGCDIAARADQEENR